MSRYLTAAGTNVPAISHIDLGGTILCRCMVDGRLSYSANVAEWDDVGEWISSTWPKVHKEYPHRTGVVFQIAER